MIFVTVGNVEPFDRLIHAFDEWLANWSGTKSEEVVAQIGTGRYQPRNCEHVQFLTPAEYQTTFENARVVVSHAFMGTVITAIGLNKPLIIMPRRAALGEQRNEHQLATVRYFRKLELLQVAESHAELALVLNRTLGSTASSEANIAQESASVHWAAGTTLTGYAREFVT